MNLPDIVDKLPDHIREGWPGPVQLSRIERHPGRGFWITDDPADEAAVTFGARAGGPNSELIDLGAVCSDGTTLTLRGAAGLTGLHCFDHADRMGKPLRLFASPLDWLAAGGHGAAVVDWFLAAQQLARINAPIVLDDEAHAELVWAKIRRYGAPMPELRTVFRSREAA